MLSAQQKLWPLSQLYHFLGVPRVLLSLSDDICVSGKRKGCSGDGVPNSGRELTAAELCA